MIERVLAVGVRLTVEHLLARLIEGRASEAFCALHVDWGIMEGQLAAWWHFAAILLRLLAFRMLLWLLSVLR